MLRKTSFPLGLYRQPMCVCVRMLTSYYVCARWMPSQCIQMALGLPLLFKSNAKCRRNSFEQFGNRLLKKANQLLKPTAICNMLHEVTCAAPLRNANSLFVTAVLRNYQFVSATSALPVISQIRAENYIFNWKTVCCSVWLENVFCYT